MGLYGNGYRGIDPNAPESEKSQINGVSDTMRGDYSKIDFGAGTPSPYLNGISSDMASRYAAAGGRPAPTMGAASAGSASMVDPTKINMGEDNADAGGQAAFLRALAAKAAGYGPSAGSDALWKGYGATMAGNMSALQSGPQSGPVGAGMRGYADTAMAGAATVGNEAAMAREQERTAAMNQLGALANAYRGSSLGMANTAAGLSADASYANANAANQFGLANAGFQQSANENNLGAYLTNQAANNSMLQSMFAGQKGISDFNRDAWLQNEADTSQMGAGLAALGQAKSQANWGTAMGVMSALSGGMLAAMKSDASNPDSAPTAPSDSAASDRRLKTKVAPADDELARFLADIETEAARPRAKGQRT